MASKCAFLPLSITPIQPNDFDSEAISKVISPHPSKRSQPGNHYFLFVDLESAEEADRAIKTLGGVSAVWGSSVRINKARGNSQKPAERDKWDESKTKPETSCYSNAEEENSSKSMNWRALSQRPDNDTGSAAAKLSSGQNVAAETSL